MDKFKEWLESMAARTDKNWLTFKLGMQVTMGGGMLAEEDVLEQLRQFEAEHPDVKVIEQNRLTGAAYNAVVDFTLARRQT